MEDWLKLGLLAAFAFGSFAIMSKVAMNQKYFGVPANVFLMFFMVGALASFAIYFLWQGVGPMPSSTGMLFVIATGVVWAIGQIAVFVAFSRGADVARLTPIYNMNTLIAVVLGIVLLHEAPDMSQMVRVLGGAVLIVIGGILVSV